MNTWTNTQKQKGRRKHIPMRTCVACRQSQPKRSLVRIVSSPERGIVVDPSGKLAGRGAYLCRDLDCWEKALALDNILSRALRATISDDDRAVLLACMERELKGESGRAAEG